MNDTGSATQPPGNRTDDRRHEGEKGASAMIGAAVRTAVCPNPPMALVRPLKVPPTTPTA